ncbi:hypothetical protein ACJX0J_030880, partial [Zea mays]
TLSNDLAVYIEKRKFASNKRFPVSTSLSLCYNFSIVFLPLKCPLLDFQQHITDLEKQSDIPGFLFTYPFAQTLDANSKYGSKLQDMLKMQFILLFGKRTCLIHITC